MRERAFALSVLVWWISAVAYAVENIWNTLFVGSSSSMLSMPFWLAFCLVLGMYLYYLFRKYNEYRTLF